MAEISVKEAGWSNLWQTLASIAYAICFDNCEASIKSGIFHSIIKKKAMRSIECCAGEVSSEDFADLMVRILRLLPVLEVCE